MHNTGIAGKNVKRALILLLVFSLLFLASVPAPNTLAADNDEKTESLVSLQGVSGKPGNIFTEGETPEINLNFIYNGTQKTDFFGNYKVITYDNRKISEGKLSGSFSSGDNKKTVNVKLDNIADKGTYTLLVDVETSDGRADFQGEVPFSIVPDTQGVPQNHIFGVNTHFAQGIGDPETLLTLAKEAGVGFIRDEYYWRNVETVKGEYRFDYDRYIDVAVSKGLEVLLILSYGNSFYGEVGSDEFNAGYANYCKAMASHLKGKVKHFEIWNEWNGGMGNDKRLGADAYYKMLKAAYTAIKEVNPEAVVIAGATVLADYDWAGQLLKAGGAEYMDAFSYHPYPSSPEGGGYLEIITNIKDVLERNNFKGQVWITENGWPNSPKEKGGYTELQSAAYIVQTNVITAANAGKADRLNYYSLMNSGIGQASGDNFGLLKNEKEFAAKLGYIAYAAYAKTLGEAEFVKAYELDKDIRLYKFHRNKDNKDILVAWTSGEIKTMGLKLGAASFNAVDIFGNSTEVAALRKVYNATLSSVPIYLEGSFSEKITADKPLFKLDSEEKGAVPGDNLVVNIGRDGDGKKQTGHYEVKLPEGWELLTDNKFKKGDEDRLVVKVPEKLTESVYDITIYPVGPSGQRMGNLQLAASRVEPFAVTVAPAPLDTAKWNKWELEVSLTNNHQDTVLGAGTLKIAGPEMIVDGQAYSYPELKPGETRVVKLPLSTIDFTPPKVPAVIPISQNKPASAAAVESGRDARFAFDGDEGSRWCAVDNKAGYWLKVDLEAQRELMGSEVMWEKADLAYKYIIEVSNDDINWRVAVDRTNNKEASKNLRDLFNASARYVRITTPELPAANTWMSIWEFRIYDTENPIPKETAPPSKDIQIEVNPAEGDSFLLKKLVTFHASSYAENSITIDGNFDAEEWNDAMKVTVDKPENIQLMGSSWKGPQDLSMSIRSKWDTDNLYLAVQVMDDVHYQTNLGNALWQADGLQMGIEPYKKFAPGTGGYSEIGFALNSGDNLVYSYRWNGLSGMLPGDLKAARCAVSRFMDMATNYEIAIPWTEIMPEGFAIEPGADIGFSILANDSDGAGRRGYIEYNSGIGRGKDPSVFGDLLLIDANGKFVPKTIPVVNSAVEERDGWNPVLIYSLSGVLLLLAGAAVFLLVYKKRKNS